MQSRYHNVEEEQLKRKTNKLEQYVLFSTKFLWQTNKNVFFFQIN